MVKKVISALLCAVIVFAFASCADSDKSDKEQAQQKPELVYNVFDSAYSSYDASAVSAYADLCKAVSMGESSVRFNLGMFDNVLQLFYTSFPLNCFVKNIEKNEDKSGVTITYTLEQAEVTAKADEFTAKVDEILKSCSAGKVGERAFAIKMYNYVASNYVESSANEQNVYTTIMKGEGNTQTCAGALAYLLRQGGVSTASLIATDAGGAGWNVCLAEFDGENYLLDPVTEKIANGGKQLVYFGMTNEDAAKEGLSNFVYTNRGNAPVCDNPYFDACRLCSSWEITENGTALLVTQNNDEIVQIAL